MRMHIKVSYIFLSILTISTTFLLANQKISIKGIIVDEETNKPLPYANIEIKNTNQGTISNIEGKFEINLEPQNTILKISFIGYQTKTISINQPVANMEIKLIPTPLLGEEIKVYAYNWVERFILKAIEKKHEIRKQLKYYTALAYSKSNFLYDSKDKIFGMLEAVSKISYQSPNLYQENVLNTKTPPNLKNVPYEVLAIKQQLNLYREDMKVSNFAIISPLNDNALDYYEYNINQKYLSGIDTIISIKISPKTENKPLFNGELLFNKTTFILIEAKLRGNTDVKNGAVDSLNVFQKYSIKDNFYNLPVFTKFELRMNFLGIPYYFSQEYSFINFVINDSLNEPYISADNSLQFEPKLSYNLDAQRNEIFIIPLTEEEKQYEDVIERVFTNAPFYRKVLMFVFTELLPASLDQPAEIAGIKIEKLSNWYRYNKVEGNFLGAEYQFFNQTNFNLFTNIGYSFGLKKILFQTRTRYKGLLAELEDVIVNLGNFNYNKTGQSISTLFSHEDDLNYYRSQRASLSFTQNLSSKISIKAAVQYEKQKPLKNNTNFSLFNKDRVFEPNFRINNYNNHKAGLSLNYIENPDMINGRTVLYRGSSFLNASISYFRTNKSVLKSTEDRDAIDINLHRYQTIYSPIAIDLKAAYHVQDKSDFIQQMNFSNSEQMFLVNNNNLSFYTVENYDFYLKDYLRLSGDLTLFNLPQIYTLRMSLGALVSFLRPLEQIEIEKFNSLKENFWEYGIALKGVSVFNFYLLTNSFNNRQVKLKMKFEL